MRATAYMVVFIAIVALAPSVAGCPEEVPCPIVINELMINPHAVTDARGEWIELHNSGGEPVDLRNWSLRDGKRDSITIGTGLIVEPGGYVVLARNGDTSQNGGVHADYVYRGMRLANTSDSIFLQDPSGGSMDSVIYSKDTFALPIGCSIELRHPGLENADGCSWGISRQEFGDGDRGTPGMRNSVYADPSVAPLMAYPPQLLVFGKNNDAMVQSYCAELNELSKSVLDLSADDRCDALVHLAEASVMLQRISSLAHGLTALRARSLLPELDACILECRAILDSGQPAPPEDTRPTALFCDTKGQYYHHGRAGLLRTLIGELGMDMKVQNTGDITPESLRGHMLVIVTNPQERFDQGEVRAIQGYLAAGGNLLITGQYFKYIMADELNCITAEHGIMFTETEIVDMQSNTGKYYYPLISGLDPSIFPPGVKAVHYANGCVLELYGAIPLLYADETAEVLDGEGQSIPGTGRPILAALSADGTVLAISSSTMITTSLFRGDNYGALREMLSMLIGNPVQHT